MLGTNLSTSSPVYQSLCAFFDAYLVRRDLDAALAQVTEDIYSLGTGVHEEAHGRAEFAALLQEELHSEPNPNHYQIHSYWEKEVAPGIYSCLCQIEVSAEVPGEGRAYFSTRLTAGFRAEEGKYRAFSLHMSCANPIQQEREFFPLHYAAQELKKMNADSQSKLAELFNEIVPGGIMGGYLEPDFPLYIINDHALDMLGYTYSEFCADTEEKIANTIHPDDLPGVIRAIADSFAASDKYDVEYRLRKKDGSYLWVHDVGRKIVTEEGRPAIISVLVDISERVAYQTLLKDNSIRDFLAGIYNRRGAEECMSALLAAERASYGFLLLDLDDFKQINDRFGHATGDRVLQMAAAQLRAHFPDGICARLGGDEFVVLVPNLSELEVFQLRAQSLCEAYRKSLSTLCAGHQAGMSIGGLFFHQSRSFSSLYVQADQLLYQVKHHRKDGICIHSLP